jgi:hypothetical protein
MHLESATLNRPKFGGQTALVSLEGNSKPEAQAQGEKQPKLSLEAEREAKSQVAQVPLTEISTNDLNTETKDKAPKPKTGIDVLEKFLRDKSLNTIADFILNVSDAHNPVRKIVSNWLNGATAAINMGVEFSKLKENKAGSLIGQAAYRSFLLLNCGLGTLTGLKQNRGLMALANAVDIPFAFLPVKWIYSARRLYAGLMELDNAAVKSSNSLLKPEKGKPFNSLGDSFKVVFERVNELSSEIANDISKIMSDTSRSAFEKTRSIFSDILLNNQKGLMGFLGATGSLGGLLLNATGKHGAGKIVGDVLGMTGLVLDRASLQNLEKGRFFNWLSGVFFGMGAIGDLTGETHLQMGSDALAKIFTQVSNIRNEVQRNDLESIVSPFKNPVKFIAQASSKLAEEFLFKKETVNGFT